MSEICYACFGEGQRSRDEGVESPCEIVPCPECSGTGIHPDDLRMTTERNEGDGPQTQLEEARP